MSTFIELSVNVGDAKNPSWQTRLLNMNNCIRIKEHDATEQFKIRPVAEPFASQPLFCLLTMVYLDGDVEKIWVHSSKQTILNKIGHAQHTDFVEPVDIASIRNDWDRKRVDTTKTRFSFN